MVMEAEKDTAEVSKAERWAMSNLLRGMHEMAFWLQAGRA
jgi:hypothetical protein